MTIQFSQYTGNSHTPLGVFDGVSQSISGYLLQSKNSAISEHDDVTSETDMTFVGTNYLMRTDVAIMMVFIKEIGLFLYICLFNI